MSVSTVSRVLNDHPYVADGIRERVARAMEELAYRPDVAARSMRTGASRAIGFVVSDISNPLFAAIAGGADEVLHPHGYSLVLANSANDDAREAEAVGTLSGRRVDGLLVSLADEFSPGVVERLAQFRGVVLLDRELPGLPFDQVLTDHRSGIRAAVEHLRGLGHTRIALIAGHHPQRGTRERTLAFREAMGDLLREELVRVVEPTRESGERATRELLRLAEPPTAILAAHNLTFGGIVAAVRDLRVRVPDDLSLVTCDDSDLVRLHDPPVDVVDRDAAALGRAAATLLVSRLEEAQPTRQIVLPTFFEPRASSAPPRA